MSVSTESSTQAELLTSVLDSSLDGIMSFASRRDDSGRIVDFIVNVANRRAEEIVGRTAGEMLGKGMLELFPGNWEDGLFDAYCKVVETGEPFSIEHHYAHDNLDHWFSIRAAKCGDGFAVTFGDITAYKSSQEYFRVLFDNSSDPHLVFTEEGIIDCNQAATKLLGYDCKEELLNVHPAELSPEFQPDGRRSLEKCVEMDSIARTNGYHRFDWDHQHKDGRVVPVEVTINTVRLIDKEVMLVVWHDLTDRIKAEQSIQESNALLNEAQELTQVGNWQWFPEDGTVTWSEQTKRIFEIPLDQDAPNYAQHKEIIHPEDFGRWKSTVEGIFEDHQPYLIRFRIRLANYRTRTLEGRGRCDVDAEGKITRVYGTVQDVTEAQIANDERERLSLVARSTESSVVLFNAKGRVTWANRAFCTLNRCSLDQVIDQHFSVFYHRGNVESKSLGKIRSFLDEGNGFTGTITKYRVDGSSLWFEIEARQLLDAGGRFDNCMIVERDVTTRVIQQQEIEEQRERLDFALQASRSGFWDWDVQNDELKFSDTWYQMLGYERDAFPSHVRTWIDLSHPEDVSKTNQALQSYSEGKTDRYVSEKRLKNRAGEWQWVLEMGRAVEHDRRGKVKRIVGLHVDIRDQKRSEAELLKARDLAEQANTAKSAFLANMSHEIRTPMNAILGYTDLLLDQEQTEEEKHDHAKTIRRSGKHLLSILNDILDISKIEAGKMTLERVSCKSEELFEDVISLMGPKARNKDLVLTFKRDGHVPDFIESDPTRIRQVLINLIGNAVKFTSHGGISLRVRTEPASDGMSMLYCEVTDSGLGISDDQISRLFKPFSQANDSTTRKFGGTGLGLSICKNLCEMLGGSLSCKSTLGEGSVFTACFKVKAVQSAAESAPTKLERANDTKALQGKRVLIVEDGPDNQRLFKHYLTKAGANVVLAENGAIGRDAALEASHTDQPFDIVLMDMQMPVLDGYNATRQLREATYDRPIIALTAHASAEDRDKCLAAGCTDYLSKPVDRNELIELAARYIDFLGV